MTLGMNSPIDTCERSSGAAAESVHGQLGPLFHRIFGRGVFPHLRQEQRQADRPEIKDGF